VTPIVKVVKEPIHVASLKEEDLDIPTIVRENQDVASQAAPAADKPIDTAYLDIPAFLRRQAD